jgi:hypothetical protein
MFARRYGACYWQDVVLCAAEVNNWPQQFATIKRSKQQQQRQQPQKDWCSAARLALRSSADGDQSPQQGSMCLLVLVVLHG